MEGDGSGTGMGAGGGTSSGQKAQEEMTVEKSDVSVKGEESRAEQAERSSSSRRSAPDDEDNDDERESRAPKRTRKPDPDVAARSRRMFGMLNSTLNKAKEDNARRSSGEAARKRAEIEARARDRLKAEDETMRETKLLTEELRQHVRRLFALVAELEADNAAVRLRKAQKRRLASFLVTESELARYDGEGSRVSETFDGRALAPEIALAIGPVSHRYPNQFKRPDGHPVYFLPKKILAQQDDRLDDQEDRVDAEIEEVQTAWEKSRTEKEEQIAALSEKIERIREDMEKLEEKAGRGKNQAGDRT